MSFDEEPDAPLHGECAAEIHRLQADMARARQAGFDEAREQAAQVAFEYDPGEDEDCSIQDEVAKAISAIRPRADKSLPGDRNMGGGILTFPGEPRCPKHNSPCGYDCMDRTPTCVWCSDKHDGGE